MTTTISIIQSVKDLAVLRNRTSFNYTFDSKTIASLEKNFVLKDSLYLLAKQSEEFAGFCSVDRNWWEENYFFLREILVDPKYRKTGLGKDLMARCIDHARTKKATGVVTETAFDNTPMQKLCESFKFEKWYNPEWKEGITYKLIF
jgi:GNAT superfamily N-acetyltransferase